MRTVVYQGAAEACCRTQSAQSIYTSYSSHSTVYMYIVGICSHVRDGNIAVYGVDKLKQIRKLKLEKVLSGSTVGFVQ